MELVLSPTILCNFIKLNFQLPTSTNENDLSLIFIFCSYLKRGRNLWKKEEGNSERMKKKNLNRRGRILWWKEEINSEKRKESLKKEKGLSENQNRKRKFKKRKKILKKGREFWKKQANCHKKG